VRAIFEWRPTKVRLMSRGWSRCPVVGLLCTYSRPFVRRAPLRRAPTSRTSMTSRRRFQPPGSQFQLARQVWNRIKARRRLPFRDREANILAVRVPVQEPRDGDNPLAISRAILGNACGPRVLNSEQPVSKVRALEFGGVSGPRRPCNQPSSTQIAEGLQFEANVTPS
jgi:hypothetical protein